MSGIEVHDLHLIPDARGWLMDCVRSDSPWFHGFGQVYVTLCYPGVVKAWHRHLVKTDVFVCVQGMARAVVAGDLLWPDTHDGSVVTRKTQEFVIGPLNPKVLVIPPGLWHGFAAVGNESCLILNIPDRAYDPTDEERMPWDAIPFNWKKVDG